jgi:hypothetical protein
MSIYAVCKNDITFEDDQVWNCDGKLYPLAVTFNITYNFQKNKDQGQIKSNNSPKISNYPIYVHPKQPCNILSAEQEDLVLMATSLSQSTINSMVANVQHGSSTQKHRHTPKIGSIKNALDSLCIGASVILNATGFSSKKTIQLSDNSGGTCYQMDLHFQRSH